MNRQNQTNRSHGFTFIEVVMAIAILSVIMGIASTALFQIMRGKKYLDDERDMRAISNAFLTRVTRELQLASPEVTLLPPQDNPDQRYPARTTFLGEAQTIADGRSGDTITFMASEAGQYLPDGSAHSGVVQIRYRVERDPDAPEGNNDAPYILVRDETPNIRPFEKAYKRTMTFPVAKNIISLSFRYYDSENETWVDTWGKDNRLMTPAMVRFSVVMQSPLGKRDTYSTTVALTRGEDPL